MVIAHHINIVWEYLLLHWKIQQIPLVDVFWMMSTNMYESPVIFILACITPAIFLSRSLYKELYIYHCDITNIYNALIFFAMTVICM